MSKIFKLELNNYVKPDTERELFTGNKYILNGHDNNYYKFLENMYNGSTTNAAIIDRYVKYLYGDGLVNSETQEGVGYFISNQDVRSLLMDYKRMGQCALEVIYSLDGTRVVNVNRIPIKQVGICNSPTAIYEVDEYWVCYDWNYKYKFEPRKIYAFGKTPVNEMKTSEILVIRNLDDEPFFSLPDYQSGLSYCKIEEELGNYFQNHIENGLSAGVIVNVTKDSSDTQDDIEETVKYIRSELSGSLNRNKTVISINNSAEQKTTFDVIPSDNKHKEQEFLVDICFNRIMIAHRANPKLFGDASGNGLSSNTDELSLYKEQFFKAEIFPMREVILDGLNSIFRINEPEATIEFMDFQKEDIQEITDVTTEDVTTEDSAIQMSTCSCGCIESEDEYDIEDKYDMEDDIDEEGLINIIKKWLSDKFNIDLASRTIKRAKKSQAKKARAGAPRPPFHDNCKCILLDNGNVRANADACEYCRGIIKKFYR